MLLQPQLADKAMSAEAQRRLCTERPLDQACWLLLDRHYPAKTDHRTGPATWRELSPISTYLSQLSPFSSSEQDPTKPGGGCLLHASPTHLVPSPTTISPSKQPKYFPQVSACHRARSCPPNRPSAFACDYFLTPARNTWEHLVLMS